MKKWIARVFSILFMIAAVLNLNLTSVAAAGQKANFTIALNKTSVMVGEEVTATITLTTTSTMMQAEYEVVYDSNILKFKSCDTADVTTTSPDGTIPVKHDPAFDPSNPAKSVTYNIVFTAKNIGETKITFANATVPVEDESEEEFGVSQATPSYGSASLKVWAKGSNDSSLKRLEISGSILHPAFSPATTWYDVWVEDPTTSITISADPNNADATTKQIGDPGNLQHGDNYVKYIVTAPNGSTTEYTIHITRKEPPKPTEEPTAPPVTEAPTVPSVEETTTEAPKTIEVTWNNTKYYLSNAFTQEQIIEGFTAAELNYKGQTIAGIQSESGLCLYYLIPLVNEEETTEPENSGEETLAETESTSETDSNPFLGNGKFYLYNETADDFYPYTVLNIQNRNMILAPLAWAGDAPEGVLTKDITVFDHVIESYISPDQTEFAYFCALNEKNEYMLYSLDTVEVTVQRVSGIAVTPGETAEDHFEQMSSMADEIASLQAENATLSGNNKSLSTFRNLLVIGAGTLIFILFVLLIYLFVRETLRLKKEKEVTNQENNDEEGIEIEEIGFDDDSAFSVDSEETMEDDAKTEE